MALKLVAFDPYNENHATAEATSAALRKQVLSYRAERPRDRSLAVAVNDAWRFIDLIPATATLPQVALADDGEVNMYWRGDGLLIDVGFVGDGMMHYYVSHEAQGVDVDASIQLGDRSLPQDIQKTIPGGLGSGLGTCSGSCDGA